jgi:hypothetical protein
VERGVLVVLVSLRDEVLPVRVAPSSKQSACARCSSAIFDWCFASAL